MTKVRIEFGDFAYHTTILDTVEDTRGLIQKHLDENRDGFIAFNSSYGYDFMNVKQIKAIFIESDPNSDEAEEDDED